jgi:hypothetical protein
MYCFTESAKAVRFSGTDWFVRTQGSFGVSCIGEEAGKSTGATGGVLAHRRTRESFSAAKACRSCTGRVLAAILDLADISVRKPSA